MIQPKITVLFVDGPGGTGKTTALAELAKRTENSWIINCDYLTITSEAEHLKKKHLIPSLELNYTVKALLKVVEEIEKIKRDVMENTSLSDLDYLCRTGITFFVDRSFISNAIYSVIARVIDTNDKQRLVGDEVFDQDVVELWQDTFSLWDKLWSSMSKNPEDSYKEIIFLNANLQHVMNVVNERGRDQGATMVTSDIMQYKFSRLEYMFYSQLTMYKFGSQEKRLNYKPYVDANVNFVAQFLVDTPKLDEIMKHDRKHFVVRMGSLE